jgi:hypothetical protein
MSVRAELIQTRSQVKLVPSIEISGYRVPHMCQCLCKMHNPGRNPRRLDQDSEVSEYSAQDELVSQTRTLATRTDGRSGYLADGLDM